MDDKDKNANGKDKKVAEKAQSKPPAKALRVGILIAVAVVAVLIFRGISDDDSSEPSTSAAEVVSVEELADRASPEDPIYWAGLQDGTELELSSPEEGRTLVRYLPEGAEAGDESADALTVGTYDYADAADALRDLGEEATGVIAAAPGGGVVFFDRTRPQNVYLAYPDSDIQVEVYDPDPKRALSLVASGKIVPVSG